MSDARPTSASEAHVAFVLVGATAVGKSAVAEWIAGQCNCDILSADSMTTYAGMDLGTAKPDASARARVMHLGIDLATPDQTFSVGAYLDAVRSSLSGRTYGGAAPAIGQRSRSLLVAGGTGLYVKALLCGLDSVLPPDASLRATLDQLHAAGGVRALRDELQRRDPARLKALADPENPRRLIRAIEMAEGGCEAPGDWKSRLPPQPVVGLRMPSEQLRARIAARVADMFRRGLLEEVRALCSRYPAWSPTARHAIGYAEACDCLAGLCSEAVARERTTQRTVQLAKRQRTWFTHQLRVDWVNVDESAPVEQVAAAVLERWRMHGPVRIAG
jgi:tRNA dimethylallyltransferase